MAFTANDVKTLREQTGAGMMDCKKALTSSDGRPFIGGKRCFKFDQHPFGRAIGPVSGDGNICRNFFTARIEYGNISNIVKLFFRQRKSETHRYIAGDTGFFKDFNRHRKCCPCFSIFISL